MVLYEAPLPPPPPPAPLLERAHVKGLPVDFLGGALQEGIDPQLHSNMKVGRVPFALTD